MSASTSQSEDGVRVEKGPEGGLKKTISTMTSSTEPAACKGDDKSTFRGPDSGSSKFAVEELKKLKVTLEFKKKKPVPATSGAAIDPSSITPYRRPDQVTVTEEPSRDKAEDVGVDSQGPLVPNGGHSVPVLEELKIPFSAKRKYVSEHYQFDRATKRHCKGRDPKECDAIGYVMSKKLSRMDSEQAFYAERLMNKILEMGYCEKLSSSTKIKNEER